MLRSFWLSLLLIPAAVTAQNLTPGGLAGTAPLVLTPSADTNRAVQGRNPFDLNFMGLRPETEPGSRYAFVWTPKLPANWHWVAAFNVPVGGQAVNFFYYDSWVGSPVRFRTNGRLRTFENDLTARIKSNCYHIALQREFVAEHETFLLLISPERQTVVVELPAEVYGTARRLTYDMDAHEAKFVHIVRPPQEYTVVNWAPEPHLRQVQPLTDWQFHLGDVPGASARKFRPQGWDSVRVPHTWNTPAAMFDMRNQRDTLDITEMFRRDLGWYRTTFVAPAAWRDQYVRVNFLAANQVAKVWLNGQYLGQHVGGYTGFHFGLNDHLRYGKENVLTVQVDNRFDFDIPPHTADYNFPGGLYREVSLEVWSPTFIKDSFVRTPRVTATEADVAVTHTLRNTTAQAQRVRVVTNLVNPYGEIAATRIAEAALPPGEKTTLEQRFDALADPLLWSPDAPQLYQLVTTLYDEGGKAFDQKSEPFGLRYWEFTTDRGFFLNGLSTKLRGVNVHQDRADVGWAMDSTQKREDYLLMKQMGVNYVRMSHYPHHPYELYLCDSLGLIVWAEIPVVNTVGKEKFVKNAVKMMEEMIVRDKNHPSILMWGVGNEYFREFFDDETAEWALRCTEAVAAKAKALDPDRPTIQAQNDLRDDRIMPLTDLHGRNRYFGWYSQADVYEGVVSFEGFGAMMEKDRQQHPEWKVLVSEYGAEGKYGFHVADPVRFDHSETYQLAFHKAYWDYIEQTDWILGGTIWNMFDFVSWAKIGNVPHINQKGMMTYDRQPKSVYYFYQSRWTTTPMVYIASHTQPHRRGTPGQAQSLEVFSNCDSVALWLNGEPLGVRSRAQEFVWSVPLAEGPHHLQAVGYHRTGTVADEQRFHFRFARPDEQRKVLGTDSD